MEAKEYLDIHRPVIERCKSGDRRAQYELYKLYSKAMYNVSLRITNNTAEAEDVLQEAFLNAFQNINSYKWEASFGSWLKKIVINQSIGVIRKRKFSFTTIEDEKDIEDEINFNEEELLYKVDTIKKAMQQLSEGYRLVLSLYLFEGYDHAEIGQVLNITESTSKSQYLRAKRKLTEIMEKSKNNK